MSNSINKNIQKTVVTGTITSVSTIVVWVINKYVADMPTEVSAATVIVIASAIAGAINFIKHGPFRLPFKK